MRRHTSVQYVNTIIKDKTYQNEICLSYVLRVRYVANQRPKCHNVWVNRIWLDKRSNQIGCTKMFEKYCLANILLYCFMYPVLPYYNTDKMELLDEVIASKRKKRKKKCGTHVYTLLIALLCTGFWPVMALCLPTLACIHFSRLTRKWFRWVWGGIVGRGCYCRNHCYVYLRRRKTRSTSSGLNSCHQKQALIVIIPKKKQSQTGNNHLLMGPDKPESVFRKLFLIFRKSESKSDLK